MAPLGARGDDLLVPPLGIRYLAPMSLDAPEAMVRDHVSEQRRNPRIRVQLLPAIDSLGSRRCHLDHDKRLTRNDVGVGDRREGMSRKSFSCRPAEPGSCKCQVPVLP